VYRWISGETGGERERAMKNLQLGSRRLLEAADFLPAMRREILAV